MCGVAVRIYLSVCSSKTATRQHTNRKRIRNATIYFRIVCITNGLSLDGRYKSEILCRDKELKFGKSHLHHPSRKKTGFIKTQFLLGGKITNWNILHYIRGNSLGEKYHILTNH